MLHEYDIPKPAALRGYPLHRMVMGLTKGKPALFADEGKTLILRTEASIDAEAKAPRSPAVGDLSAFELRACVSKKRKGRHIYFHPKNWQARHDWLDAKGLQHGFAVLTVHSSAERVKIEDKKRRFWIDQTDFTGILKVTDADLFHNALLNGVGSTARTFGFGLLIIH